MKTIVFFCIPAHGHTNPTLGVVRALTARGHQVVYYSYEPFREAIEAAGARFVGCEVFDAQQHLTAEEGARVGSDLGLSLRVLVDTTLALDGPVCREMARLRPACIVADSMAVWGKAVAEKLGIPFVCSTTTFAFNQVSAKIMKQGLRELVGLLRALPEGKRQVRRLRRQGYPVKNILDLIRSDERLPTIVYTSREFQPCAETFSEKFVFVGPSIRPAAGEFSKTREKLVYVSMGTVNNAMLPLYRSCIEAFRGCPWQVVLSVGERVSPEEFGPLPENVGVFPRVDQMAVLEQADVFLTHCGMNSVSEGLYFGVPLVMLPQTSEQKGVAARVAQLGAGVYLEGTGARAIRETVARVLDAPSCRERAAEIGAGFRRCGGAEAAADWIEAVGR